MVEEDNVAAVPPTGHGGLGGACQHRSHLPGAQRRAAPRPGVQRDQTRSSTGVC